MKKLYVITRRDLGLAYSGVQAGHAVAQWMIEHPKQEWNNHTLVYLSVEDEDELDTCLCRAIAMMEPTSVFHEPDIGDEMTAIACLTDTKIFKKLKLYGA